MPPRHHGDFLIEERVFNGISCWLVADIIFTVANNQCLDATVRSTDRHHSACLCFEHLIADGVAELRGRHG